MANEKKATEKDAIAQRQTRDLVEEAEEGAFDHGGLAGPGVGGSGVHGMQDDVNRGGPRLEGGPREEKEPKPARPGC